MTIAYVTNVQGTGNSPVSLSLGHAVSVGDLLFAFVISGNEPATNTGVTFSDNINQGLWNVPSSLVYFQSSFGYLQMGWIRADTAAASPGPTIKATFGAGFGFSGLTIAQYNGFPTGWPAFVTADFSVNHGTGTAQSATNLTNTVAPELIVQGGFTSSQNAGTFTGSFTNRQSFNNMTLGDVVESTSSNVLTYGSTTGATSVNWIVVLGGFSDQPPSNPLIGQATPISGSTNLGTVAGDMYWITAPAYASGTAINLNVGLQTVGSATALLLGLYDQNGNLLASGTVSSPAVGLNTASIANTPIVYGRNYSISVQPTTNVGIPAIASNNTGTGPFHATNTPNTVPSTLSGSPFVDGHGIMTLYATGALGAAGVGTPLGGPARTSWHWRGSGSTS